ncbi:MAG: fibronectin type III domain-containing protein, partial [Patescibacteria group bacterium]
MHRLNYLLSFLLVLFFVPTALAANFEGDIESGFIKKNALETEHFILEFSDLILGQTDDDGDGISNVIELLAESAEESWDVVIEDMNYEEPVPDGSKLTVILDDRNEFLFPGAIGVTTLLSDGVTPVVAVDPWLTDGILEVTMAHEFFHSVQFGYDPGFASTYSGINFAEASAVWVEDVVYDEVDDYLNYLESFFNYPDYSIFASIVPDGTLYEYALMIWPKFLSEYYEDDSIILDIWETYFDSNLDETSNNKSFEAVRDVIEGRGDTLSDIYREFTLWNLMSESYEEGEGYPGVLTLVEPILGEYTLISEEYAPALYGSNYLYFENTDEEDDFHFHVVKSEGITYLISVIPVQNGVALLTEIETVEIGSDELMDEEIILENLDGLDAVVLVSPIADDLDPAAAEDGSFDIGYLYYYAGDFGDVVMDGEELSVEENLEKEGETSSPEDTPPVPDSLILSVQTYDEESVTLSWNRLTDDDIEGYEIHYGLESGNYDDVKIIDKDYTTSSTVSGLEEGETYYFQLIATDNDADEVGDPSQEIAVEPEEWLYTDLSYLDPYFEAIEGLSDEGIFEGYPDGSFWVNDDINRAELTKILVEGQGITPSAIEHKNCF